MSIDIKEIGRLASEELLKEGFVPNISEVPLWRRMGEALMKKIYYQPEDPNALPIVRYRKFIVGAREFSIGVGANRFRSGDFTSGVEIETGGDGKQRPKVVYRDQQDQEIKPGTAVWLNPFVDEVVGLSRTVFTTTERRESPNQITIGGAGKIITATKYILFNGDPVLAYENYGGVDAAIEALRGAVTDTALDAVARNGKFKQEIEGVLEESRLKNQEPAAELESVVSAAMVGMSAVHVGYRTTGMGILDMAVMATFSPEMQELSNARAEAEKTRIEGDANTDIDGKRMEKATAGIVRGLGLNVQRLLELALENMAKGGRS